MPRMKLTTQEFNPKKLDVKVEKSKFKRYTGDIPKSGTIVIARVTKLWWTQADDGTSMIKLLAVAEQNEGKYEQYNGMPIWEYLVFKPEAAFRYVPWLEVFGITLLDIQRKMVVADEPDKIGDIIESIGGWEVGSDDAVCRIVIYRRKWNDEWEARVDREGWLPLDEADEVDDEDEDIDEDEDEDEEDEEPPARPASKRGAKSSTTTRSRRRAEPEPDEDEDEDDEDEDEDEIDDEADEDEEAEDDEAEDEDEEEEDEEPDEEPPARTRRGGTRSTRTSSRTSSSSRSTRTSASRPASTRRTDGGRTSTRRSTAATERTPGKRGSKGRDGGSREDPPF